MSKLLFSIILALGISLSGCGGGGGGGSSPAPNPPPPPPPPSNQAPSANAGSDQSVDEGATVSLSATAADSDGNVVSYSWNQDNRTVVTITNSETANASFVAPDVPGSVSLVFSVTVTDDDGASGSDSVTITIMDLDPPVPPDPNFIPLGDLPGGDFGSGASDVSDDGSVVVGASISAEGGEAFRWTSAGMMGLGDLPGGRFGSGAEAVSADGNVVVGTGWVDDSAHDGDEMSPFRWTSATGMVDLGDLDNCISNWGCRSSEGTDVSADGSVVVGSSNHGFDTREAFRWTSADGMSSIGALPSGRARARAYGVSADGTVIVGSDEVWENNEDSGEAFRWTAGTGMVGLGDLPDGRFASGANDVSADGSVIVGVGETAVGGEAVVWTSAGGMVGLGFLPGGDNRSYALGVSADGSMVVGQSELADSGSPSRAFVWTQANGMQSLRDMLIAKGVTGLDNWELYVAKGISADGQWIVGTGLNPLGFDEAFLANISAP